MVGYCKANAKSYGYRFSLAINELVVLSGEICPIEFPRAGFLVPILDRVFRTRFATDTRKRGFHDRFKDEMKKKLFCAVFVIGLLGSSSAATADTVTFNFADVGSSFSAFLSPDSPLVGQEIVSARIYLDVESFEGSDAANFFTDISFPIAPFPGNESAFAIFGSDLGWSGAGTFHFFDETTLFNGVFVPLRYGGETPGKGFDGAVLEGSRIEFDFVPEPGAISLILVGGVTLIGLRARFRRGTGF